MISINFLGEYSSFSHGTTDSPALYFWLHQPWALKMLIADIELNNCISRTLMSSHQNQRVLIGKHQQFDWKAEMGRTKLHIQISSHSKRTQ